MKFENNDFFNAIRKRLNDCVKLPKFATNSDDTMTISYIGRELK